MRNSFIWSLASLATVSLLGCGGGHQLETAEVTGIVSVNGKPVSQGFVVFIPLQGRRASGPIDSDGRFSLSTYSNGDGAIVGSHKVGIVSTADMQQFYKAKYDDTADHKMPKAIIPERYADPFSSKLSFEVESGVDNAANFDLPAK